ncbi:MAG: NAD(P)/FAD-dependent oxidoreductase [Vicinamibacteria bacterium]
MAGAERIVILGGGYAGMLAAARASRGGLARVTLVDARPAFVQRIRLHEALAGSEPKQLAYAPALARRGASFAQARVTGIDLARSRVRGVGLDGRELELPWDRLVLALGSRTARIPGDERAIRLDSPAAAREAHARLARLQARAGRVLVVGGGATAIEVAAELASRLPGLRLTLASREEVGARDSAAGGAHLRAALNALGVERLSGVSVASLEPGRAWLSGGGALDCDEAVCCIGFEAQALARESGLPVDAQGRVSVDPELRLPGRGDVFAAGDAAAFDFGGEALRMACATALPMGAHAGSNALRAARGEQPRPFGFAYGARCTSLGRHDGLFQVVDPEDRALPRVFTGRSGSIWKEAICRMTYAVVSGELRFGLPLYHWPVHQPQAGTALARPA